MSHGFNKEWGIYSLVGKNGGVSLNATSASVCIREGGPSLVAVSVHRPVGWSGDVRVDNDGSKVVITEKGDPADRRRPRILVKMPVTEPLQVVLSGCATLTTQADLGGLRIARAFDKARMTVFCRSVQGGNISGTDCARVCVSASDSFWNLSLYAGGKSRVTCEGPVRGTFKACASANGTVAHAGKRPKRPKIALESDAARVHLVATADELPEALRISRKPARATPSRKDVTPA